MVNTWEFVKFFIGPVRSAKFTRNFKMTFKIWHTIIVDSIVSNLKFSLNFLLSLSQTDG